MAPSRRAASILLGGIQLADFQAGICKAYASSISSRANPLDSIKLCGKIVSNGLYKPAILYLQEVDIDTTASKDTGEDQQDQRSDVGCDL